jgi:hypothetical protein
MRSSNVILVAALPYCKVPTVNPSMVLERGVGYVSFDKP